MSKTKPDSVAPEESAPLDLRVKKTKCEPESSDTVHSPLNLTKIGESLVLKKEAVAKEAASSRTPIQVQVRSVPSSSEAQSSAAVVIEPHSSAIAGPRQDAHAPAVSRVVSVSSGGVAMAPHKLPNTSQASQSLQVPFKISLQVPSTESGEGNSKVRSLPVTRKPDVASKSGGVSSVDGAHAKAGASHPSPRPLVSPAKASVPQGTPMSPVHSQQQHLHQHTSPVLSQKKVSPVVPVITVVPVVTTSHPPVTSRLHQTPPINSTHPAQSSSSKLIIHSSKEHALTHGAPPRTSPHQHGTLQKPSSTRPSVDVVHSQESKPKPLHNHNAPQSHGAPHRTLPSHSGPHSKNVVSMPSHLQGGATRPPSSQVHGTPSQPGKGQPPHSHVAAPPVEALLRHRHPVPAPPHAEVVPRHPAVPPQHPQEVPHEMTRHPSQPAAGQGYIPQQRNFYPVPPMVGQPRGARPTSVPQPPPSAASLVQPGGPGQPPAPRYPPASAFAINPFYSLSIAIDCQRATEQDSDGDTALHIAIVQDKPDMGLIQRLIDLVRIAGRSVDIFNYMQQTPLHLACIMKNADIIRLLVQAGGDPNEADRNGQTAAHHACKNDSAECLGAILRYSQMKVNLNIRNYEGYTPLHMAAMLGNPTLVTMLLEKGADINSKDSKNGWTPLFHAVTNQDTKLVHKMLESGAEVNVQSYSGNTVLHVATGRGFTDIVKILVHYGADMSLKNTQWDTPATITTDKAISSLLRGLGGGSPQSSEASSPGPAPTTPSLPMPLNDAYLIRNSAPVTSTPSKTPTMTTMTTERLKGPANEVYTVTRSVTRQDSGSGKNSDGQRAIHKQTQELLKHSIHVRKVVNELRKESLMKQDGAGGSGSNEKVVVVVPAKIDKETGRISVIVNPNGSKDSELPGGKDRPASVSDLEKKINASVASTSKLMEEDVKPPMTVLSKTLPLSSQSPSVTTSASMSNATKVDLSRDPATSLNVKRIVTPKSEESIQKSDCMYYDAKGSATVQLIAAVNGHLKAMLIEREEGSKTGDGHAGLSPVEQSHEAKVRDEKPQITPPVSSNKVTAVEPASTVENENEIRARMLSLQYKNSDAILSSRHDRKLDLVGSDPEREAASAILAMGSAYRERISGQKLPQTCDADSTVKTEQISPSAVHSSTSDRAPPPLIKPLSPPVLEREGDQPPILHAEDDDEPKLVIDETFRSKSKKKARTPTKSIPNLPPETSYTPESMDTTSDSVKLAKVKFSGIPKKFLKKKALLPLVEAESKRKKKKVDKTADDI